MVLFSYLVFVNRVRIIFCHIPIFTGAKIGIIIVTSK